MYAENIAELASQRWRRSRCQFELDPMALLSVLLSNILGPMTLSCRYISSNLRLLDVFVLAYQNFLLSAKSLAQKWLSVID